MSNIIYCYSGTGNSLNVAKAIALALGETIIIPMNDRNKKIFKLDAEIVGFVFPVHHWNMPNRVKEFVNDVQINPKAYIFAIAACGGIAINTLNDFNDIITRKGAKLSFSAVHRNVSSYIVAYERFPDPKKQIIKSEFALKQLIENIRKRVSNKQPKSKILKQILRYLMSGSVRKFPNMDKDYNILEKCNGCGTCQKVCIANNIEMTNGKPIFLHKCEQCMSCIQYCPNEAINYKDKTQKRKRYHHPNIDATELIKFRNINAL